MKKIYFWCKPASKPEGDEDKLIFYNVEEEQSIREVIRGLENKIIGNKKVFSEISPVNPSVKRWVETIMKSYPNREKYIREVEDLINTFRSVLQTKSKEKEKFIVGVLQLRDVLLLVHCRKDPSLAEVKEKLYSVKTILHPKNILRADIIKNEDGVLTLTAFEYSRKLSKGHAEFWGLEPEDVGWESLGDVILNVELETFSFPLQIPVEIEQLSEMINNRIISPMGKIKIGREEGKITKVNVYRKTMDFPSFYEYYITESEKLESYRKKFNEIVNIQKTISDFDDKFRYEEDEKYVYEITTEGLNQIVKKEHPRFVITFFTKALPGIMPANNFIWKFYQSIFENKSFSVWHAGEDSSLDPILIGSLEVYNKIEISEEIQRLTDSLLNQIQDAESRKGKLLLQSCFCRIWRENLKSKHFKFLFDFLMEFFISKELEYEFGEVEGVFQKEDIIEFKSASEYAASGKPKKFVGDKLVPTVKSYIHEGTLKRYCILYGIEDNSKIQPIYHLKSDQISEMEKIANEELKDSKVKVSIQPLPFKEGIILAVFIIPTSEDT